MSLPLIVLGALLIASALGVVLAQNPIHSALCLVVNLVGVACVFAALDAHFLAMVQIIVYAGAIMVLVIFVLMLLTIKEEERRLAGLFQLIGAGCMGAFFVVVVSREALQQFPVEQRTGESVVGSVEAVGRLLYTNYLLPFEAAGILIMAALVGAAMLAKTSYPRSGDATSSGSAIEGEGK
ncbi:MAG: NADH-quinone oxidoreductase subunit J [Bdellovibrionales bacterium]|nr:NADH-quinone oxidoreductase subunit J [Bdellovibrionales bacterium]